MAEFKDRSFIFKFFYVLLFIITFPIFFILFLLRHPFWVLTILLLIGGAAVYYPINQGVKFEDVPSWYQKKYTDLKYEAVVKARQEGVTDFVPQALLDEANKIEEEAREAKLPKGENYNSKVERSVESEEMKNELKQRRGFRKKNDDTVKEETLEGDNSSEDSTKESAVESENKVADEAKVLEESNEPEAKKETADEANLSENPESLKKAAEIEIGSEEASDVSLEEKKENSAN